MELLTAHPETQADETKGVEVEFVPLCEPDAGVVGSGPGDTSSQDDGAAVTRDAARAERKRGASMSFGLKEGGKDVNPVSAPSGINTVTP